MRYIITLIWGALLGEVIGFLVGALSATPFDPKISLVGGLIVGVIFLVITPIMTHFDRVNSKQ